MPSPPPAPPAPCCCPQGDDERDDSASSRLCGAGPPTAAAGRGHHAGGRRTGVTPPMRAGVACVCVRASLHVHARACHIRKPRDTRESSPVRLCMDVLFKQAFVKTGWPPFPGDSNPTELHPPPYCAPGRIPGRVPARPFPHTHTHTWAASHAALPPPPAELQPAGAARGHPHRRRPQARGGAAPHHHHRLGSLPDGMLASVMRACNPPPSSVSASHALGGSTLQ